MKKISAIIGILCLVVNTLLAQDIMISGVVISDEDNGEVLPGVTVHVKGTAKGTVTDINGKYTLTASPKAVLVFSFIGMFSQEIVVGDNHVIDVRLTSEVHYIDEAVITGYQKINRRLFTGSAVALRGDEVKVEGLTDISRMLEGKAAGVSVQNVSGTFGSAPKVRVRGATSITGSNKPVWVLDGVVLEDIVDVSMDQLSSGDATTLIGSSVAGLNADDIESFQILKDASATAMYGARAMNGVIVITTKKGRSGKPAVSYTGNFTINSKPTYSSYDLMNSSDQMSVYMEMERKGLMNYTKLTSGANGGVFAKMYDMISIYDGTGFALDNTPEAKHAFLQRYAMANTDWFDLLFRNSFMQDHSLSVSAGNDQSQYYASLSYLNDEGWTIADKVQRYTANMRASYKLSEKINIGFITTGSIREQSAPGTMQRKDNMVEGSYDRDFDINPFSYALNTSRALTAYDQQGNREFFRQNYAPFNIMHELENNYMDLNVMDLKLQGEFGWKILKELQYEFIGSIRYVKSSREHNVMDKANQAEAYRAAGNSTIRENNPYLYRDPDNPDSEKIVVLPQGGIYYRYEDEMRSLMLRNSLNWNKTYDSKHITNAYIGQEVRSIDKKKISSTGYGYQYDKGGIPFTDYRIIKQMLENNNNYFSNGSFYERFAAFFGTLSYSYQGRYTVGLTGRYDGTNQLGKSSGARWLPTWNVSGAWNIHTENWMEHANWIQRLTLRSTYGLTASMHSVNNSIALLLSETTRRPYLTEKETAIVIDALENSDLTWEKQYETNVGLDFVIWNGRLSFSADYYYRNCFDLIGNLRTSGIGGENEKMANYADMVSQGTEFSVGLDVVKNKNWSYRANFVFSYNKNKITHLESDPRIYDLVCAEGGAKEGYSVGGLFSIPFQGLDPLVGSPIFINEDGNVSNDVYLQSSNTEHLKYEGSIDPTTVGGIANIVRYKNLTLNVYLSYQFGNKVRLYPYYKSSYNDLSAMPKEFRDRWSMPGDEQYTNIPSILTTKEADNLERLNIFPYNTYNYSDVRVADGGFVRVKNISLSYSLPRQWVNSIKMNTLSLQLQVTNPWLIYADSKLKGQDPEFFSAGGVALPVPRQYTLTVRVGF